MQSVSIYLNFPGTTRAAFEYYQSVFGGQFLGVLTFREMGGEQMGVPEAEMDKIAHIALGLVEGIDLMGSDTIEGQDFVQGNNFYITLEADDDAEADRLFAALSDGGEVEMPLERTEWAEKYGMCRDAFGVGWMISYTGSVEFSFGT